MISAMAGLSGHDSQRAASRPPHLDAVDGSCMLLCRRRRWSKGKHSIRPGRKDGRQVEKHVLWTISLRNTEPRRRSTTALLSAGDETAAHCRVAD